MGQFYDHAEHWFDLAEGERILPGGDIESHARYLKVDVCDLDALELPLGEPILADLVRQYSLGGHVLHPALLLGLSGSIYDHLFREFCCAFLHIITAGYQA